MGDLRDQLKKAKILSDKEARRLAHEARLERKAKGREGLEHDQQQRQRELQEQQQKTRAQTREQGATAEAARRQAEEAAAVDAILCQEARRPSPGPVKWYFQTSDGHLPFLEVSTQDGRELSAGMLCVVRTGPEGSHHYRVLPTDLVRRVARVRPDVVVFAPRGVG